jgi:hypothetical protein
MTDGTVHVRRTGDDGEGNRSVCFSCGAARSAGHGARDHGGGGWWAKPRWAPPPLSSGGGG